MNINPISIILNQIENTPTVQNNLPLKNAIEKYKNGDILVRLSVFLGMEYAFNVNIPAILLT